MTDHDALRDLLIEFFQLPPATPVSDLKQTAIQTWESLAMLQLIAEIQTVFRVQFELGELERLTSYAEIRAALLRKNAAL